MSQNDSEWVAGLIPLSENLEEARASVRIASSEARLRVFHEHSELNDLQMTMNLEPTNLAPLADSDATPKLTACI